MDILHFYEVRRPIPIRDEVGSYLSDYELFNEVVRHLKERAERDMEGEGREVEKVEYSLELEMADRAGTFCCVVPWPQLYIENERDVWTIAEAFDKDFSKSKKSSQGSQIQVEVFKLRATSLLPHKEMKTYEFVGKGPDKALKGRRKCFWENGFRDTRVYERGLLHSGNVVRGPAIVEAPDSNIVLPDGWELNIDKYLNVLIEKV